MARPPRLPPRHGPGYPTQGQTDIQPGIRVKRETTFSKPLILLFKLYLNKFIYLYFQDIIILLD